MGHLPIRQFCGARIPFLDCGLHFSSAAGWSPSMSDFARRFFGVLAVAALCGLVVALLFFRSAEQVGLYRLLIVLVVAFSFLARFGKTD
jgi:hypothetical protein